MKITQEIINNLPNDHFRGMDLSYGNFRDCSFNKFNWHMGKCTVEPYDFSGCNLSYANLNCVNLERVDLKNTNLSNSFLYGIKAFSANFEGANFECAKLESVNFGCVNLKNSNLKGATLICVDFSGANIEGVNLTDTILKNCTVTYKSLCNYYPGFSGLIDKLITKYDIRVRG